MTAEEVIEDYYIAIGGYDKLKSIQTLIKKGNYIEPAYNLVLEAKQLRMRPHFRKVGNLDKVGFEEGFNGTAWEYHKGKGFILSEGEAKEAIVVASNFDFPFVDAEKNGYQLKLNGSKTIYGIDCYDIEVNMPFENTTYTTNFYFSKQTGLMLGQRKAMPIHARGDDVDLLVSYSDYKAVDGVLYPFSQIERNERTGKFLNATLWNEFIPNKNVTVSDFNPPSK
ncbi:MAG: hypothetical protein Tsb004_15430 [Allomuricauda sp.]